MEKIWIKHYAPAVPAQVNPVHDSLGQLFDEVITKFSRQFAYEHLGHKMTYKALSGYVNAFGAYLAQCAGVKKGDRVAIMLPNCFMAPIAIFAALKVGAVVVNINPLYSSSELTDVLQDATPKVLLTLDLFSTVVVKALEDVPVSQVVVACLGDLFPWPKSWLIRLVASLKQKSEVVKVSNAISFMDTLSLGKAESIKSMVVTQDDLAFLQYTGGTTGKPKAAMLTHGNLLANISQTLSWFNGVAKEGEEVNVMALPIYHIFSLTVNCFMFLALGGLNIIITNPRDLPAFIKQIKHKGITFFVGVNTLFHKILQQPQFASVRFDQLKVAVGGGMAVQETVAKEWEQATGIPILEGYGQTEASPIITINPVHNYQFKGSIGLPIPSTEVKFVNDQAREVLQGEMGEMWVRGPQVMKGYWQNVIMTKQAINSEGWLATGDVGYMDEQGYIFLCERKKDIIIVSGFNVYPNEVEAVLAAHPKVDEAAVVGVSDENSGERVKAFVVKAEDTLTEEELTAWCQESLAKYKLPKSYEFRNELPKNNVGKVLRRKLCG